MGVKSVKELTVYLKAYRLAMLIFEISKRFPPEERYAITGQVRRSSRSVCTCLREARAKGRCPAHFVRELTNCDGENSEADTSLNFAKDYGYISPQEHAELTGACTEVGKLLGSMIQNPDLFLLPDP
jgi:four helix bundle protein